MTPDVVETGNWQQPGDHGSPWTRRVVLLALTAAAVLVVVANRNDLPAAWNALRDARAGWLPVGFARRAVPPGSGRAARGCSADRAAQSAVGIDVAGGVGCALRERSVEVRWLRRIAMLSAEGRRSGRARAARCLPPDCSSVCWTNSRSSSSCRSRYLALLVSRHFSPTDGVATGLFASVRLHHGRRGDRSGSRSELRPCSVFTAGRLSVGFQQVVLRRSVRYRPDPDRADELFEAIALVKRRPRSVVPAALAAVAIDLVAVLELWVALRAVGVGGGFAVPFVAYSISTLFAVVALVPGGIGVVELSVGAVLHSFGIPVPDAAAAVVLFRVAEFWIPLAVGAVRPTGTCCVPRHPRCRELAQRPTSARAHGRRRRSGQCGPCGWIELPVALGAGRRASVWSSAPDRAKPVP